MRFAIILSAALAAVVATYTSGCTTVSCDQGTIERNGKCEPSDINTDPAICGPGTVLVGDRCESSIMCGSGTAPQPDPSDPTKTICVGTGIGSIPCNATLPCPQAATGKQTICGQLYDITNGSAFANGTDGTQCDGTGSGPCALSVTPYDAIDFGEHPGSAAPLANDSTYIDNCGRYQVRNITPGGSPFIGLGFDDAGSAARGPGGVTNTTGVATPVIPGTSTKDLEAWIAPKATTDMWATNGPPVSGGIYVAIFRAHKCDANRTCTPDEKVQNQPGVTITKSGSTVPSSDYYFPPTQTDHTSIDPTATATGSNGTGLLTGASVDDSLIYSGTGGIMDTVNCTWERKAAASLPFIVFFQVYRPTNTTGHTCTQ